MPRNSPATDEHIKVAILVHIGDSNRPRHRVAQRLAGHAQSDTLSVRTHLGVALWRFVVGNRCKPLAHSRAAYPPGNADDISGHLQPRGTKHLPKTAITKILIHRNRRS